jgi:hypothetical protein
VSGGRKEEVLSALRVTGIHAKVANYPWQERDGRFVLGAPSEDFDAGSKVFTAETLVRSLSDAGLITPQSEPILKEDAQGCSVSLSPADYQSLKALDAQVAQAPVSTVSEAQGAQVRPRLKPGPKRGANR